MVSVMRSALPKRGTRMSAARIVLSRKIEMASARRLTRRSRVRCCASPSTRHALSNPRLSSGIASQTFLGSGDITHLHNFLCESRPRSGPTQRDNRNFAAPISWGCSRSPADRRRARRDVRLRASSLGWTPGVGTSSPWIRQVRFCSLGGHFLVPESLINVLLLICYRKPYPNVRLVHLIRSGRGSRGGRPRWTGIIQKQ